ncbi:FtsX-like permease family protein [Lachnoclostridium phytofermentans]|uniref:ABC3 transporter permease C-terminal domain-containing protein n=1 Tax=Lachnoclostridium phytofermentans (strain ATCC 700394 / DSM 18823 / ISDg) TaxID=357809 RepID=A9KJF8_LACP7|nr:FtsX-like permease family protein [Lachnoclostridium phytofermentans]ABX43978.1 hypothetical protein Cphy_3631 [Lachnoclostridium phytofermentans ISDg]
MITKQSLSPFPYIKNNRKRILVLILSFGFYLTMIYGVQYIFSSTTYTFEQLLANQYQKAPFLSATEDMSPEEKQEELRSVCDQFNRYEEVSIAFPASYIDGGRIKTTIGYEYFDYPITEAKYIPTYLSHFNAKLIEGKIPTEPGEIIADQKYMRNNQLELGEEIIPGFHIVGIVKSDYYLLIGVNKHFYNYYVHVLMKNTTVHFETLCEEIGIPFSYNVNTYETGLANVSIDAGNSLQLCTNLIFIISTVVLFLCLLAVIQMYFRDRNDEWCLYHSLGYSIHSIYNLAMKELLLILGVSCILCLGLLSLFLPLFYRLAILPNGLLIQYFHPDVILKMIAVIVLFLGMCQIPLTHSLHRIKTVDILDEESI